MKADEQPTAIIRADSLEEAEAKLAAGEVEELPGPVYVQEEVACTLTLDAKQAWILGILIAPYAGASRGDWDMLRAVSDVHRRLSEAMGYRLEGLDE